MQVVKSSLVTSGIQQQQSIARHFNASNLLPISALHREDVAGGLLDLTAETLHHLGCRHLRLDINLKRHHYGTILRASSRLKIHGREGCLSITAIKFQDEAPSSAEVRRVQR